MKVELNLLENGLDFIVEGLKPTTRIWSIDNTYSVWKYSVLNVFSGIELIFKERLKLEHWSLIFEDVSNAKKQKLTQGDFISVNHNNVIKRLKGICNINIKDESINDLRKLRNKFEHFEVKIEIDECKQVIAGAIRELIVFWNENMLSNVNEEQILKFSEIIQMVSEFDAYIEKMLKKHEKKIESITRNGKGILIHCKSCENHSFMIYKDDEKICECFVCEKKITKNDLLKSEREYWTNISENHTKGLGLINPANYKYDKKCPVCEKETIIKQFPRFSTNGEEYRIAYYYCVQCIYYETERDINRRKLNKEIEELEKNHTSEEIDEILRKRIKDIEGKIKN